LGVLVSAALLLACAHQQGSHASDEGSAKQRVEVRAAHQEGQAQNDRPSEHGKRKHAEGVSAPRDGERDQPVAANQAAPAAHEPDNSGVNERDRNGAHVTPLDQSNREEDIGLTQRIRKAVMADDSLSFTAKNSKIITRDGHVTLRGVVNSSAEKATIYKCAVAVAGAGLVTNELAVDDD
jgi:osmotically-inducible protein OsmY